MSNPYETPRSEGLADSNGHSIACRWSPGEAVDMVASYFAAEGYRLESGTPAEGMYGIGSNWKRILLGAFAKRFRFKVHIEPAELGSRVSIDKGMIGAMGGAIGYARMNKELARVRGDLRKALA